MEKHYPSWRYHPTEAPRQVDGAKHEKETAPPEDGWVETPAHLPEPEPADPTACPHCGQQLPAAPSEDAPKPSAADAPTPKAPRGKKAKPADEPKVE